MASTPGTPGLFAPTDLTKPGQPATPSSSVTPVNTTLLTPSIPDAELAGRVRNLFARARNLRKPVVNQWQRNRRIFSNRSWLTTRADWQSSPEIPEIRPIIASCVGWVTDQRPTLELTPAAQPFSPYYEYLDALATDMKTAINAAWVTYNWENEIQKMVWDAYQFDIGFLKVSWDAALADGMGDVSLRRIDPFSLYPDPQASCMEDANYFIEARTVSLQELDRRFPGAASKFDIQGYIENIDEMPSTTGQIPGQMPRANPGAIAPATSARYGLPGQSRDHVAQDDTGVTLLECWMREHTIYAKDGKTRVYECWRVVCVAGGYVLMNKRATEIFPFERHPYIRYTPEDLGEFYGQSMVELLTSAQVNINKLLANMQMSADLTSNPPFIEDSRAGTQRTKMTNRPGSRITKQAGSEVRWMEPAQQANTVPDLIKFYIGEMEKISGLSAIARGMMPAGRNSTDTLDQIQEAGFVRIRLALRNLEFSLRTVGQLVSAIISEFYTDPRLISLVGPSGEKTVAELREKHFYVPGEDGSAPLRFQVLVMAGSALPTSRNARMAEANTLFAMNAIDRPSLLEAHDWPNRQAVIERMAEMDAKGISQGPSARSAAGRTA